MKHTSYTCDADDCNAQTTLTENLPAEWIDGVVVVTVSGDDWYQKTQTYHLCPAHHDQSPVVAARAAAIPAVPAGPRPSLLSRRAFEDKVPL